MRFRRSAAAVILAAIVSAGTPAAAQSPADALLARSVAYHDPEGVFLSRPLRFDIDMAHSAWWTRDVDLLVDNGNGIFELAMTWNDERIEVQRHGDRWTTRLNGSEDIDDAERERHLLGADDMTYWQNYFLFLLGLPMKMHDAGAILDPLPNRTTFEGRQVLSLRITYDPEVGTDTWYLFFDPESARLVGCRFFHDEALRDGDTMVFEGEVADGALRLPKSRTWYANSDGSLLGTDTIRSVTVVGR